MRTDRLLLLNVQTLLRARGLKQRDLAIWMGHHETWISKILKEQRGVDLKEIDRLADFFGMDGFQLLCPGSSDMTERRRGERRAGRERRSGTDRRRPRIVARTTSKRTARSG